jgi:hypothetical protein
MRRAVLLTLLLPACAGTPAPQATMTLGAVPRDARGDAVLTAMRPPAPPSPPAPTEFRPVTEAPIDCSHLKHC